MRRTTFFPICFFSFLLLICACRLLLLLLPYREINIIAKYFALDLDEIGGLVERDRATRPSSGKAAASKHPRPSANSLHESSSSHQLPPQVSAAEFEAGGEEVRLRLVWLEALEAEDARRAGRPFDSQLLANPLYEAQVSYALFLLVQAGRLQPRVRTGVLSVADG
jgi:hypothetical protein